MKRVTLLLTVIHTVAAQMTFTDNWEKRAIPNVFREWHRNDQMVDNECSWDAIAEIIRELKQIYRKQKELTNLIDRCSSVQHPVFAKEG